MSHSPGPPPQLILPLPVRGGKRPGAGRKSKRARPGVSHHGRPRTTRRYPVHVTVRVQDHVWNLRSRRCFRLIEDALEASRERGFFRVTHLSVQGNHVHLIVEAENNTALARGMKGLQVRVARALNRLMERRGPVFADRYHAHVLRTRAEVRHALAYVLGNFASHARRGGEPVTFTRLDPFALDGSRPLAGSSPVLSSPRTWLLTTSARAAASAEVPYRS
jgi:putative transposase